MSGRIQHILVYVVYGSALFIGPLISPMSAQMTGSANTRYASVLSRFVADYARLRWPVDSLTTPTRYAGPRTRLREDPATYEGLAKLCGDRPHRVDPAVLDSIAHVWNNRTNPEQQELFRVTTMCVKNVLDSLTVLPPYASVAERSLLALAAVDDPAVDLEHRQVFPGEALAASEERLRGTPGRYAYEITERSRSRYVEDLRMLAKLYVKAGRNADAEHVWRQIWEQLRDPAAAVTLAELALTRHDTVAYRNALGVAVVANTRDTSIAPALYKVLRAEGRDSAAAERWLDSLYAANVVDVAVARVSSYGARRAKRTVLVETETAPDCGGCRHRDLALMRVAERYSAEDVVVLAWHFWGPMLPAGALTPFYRALTSNESYALRTEYYAAVHGERTGDLGYCNELWVDGRCVLPSDRFGAYPELRQVLGGSSQAITDQLIASIDARLSTAPEAALRLAVRRVNDRIDATVVVDSLLDAYPAKPTLRVRIFLIQDSIRYVGSNGVRVHYGVVRAAAGTLSKDFYGFTLNPAGRGTISTTFPLSITRSAVRKTNETYRAITNAEAVKSQSSYSIRPYPASVFVLTPSHLAVVAMVQDDASGRILATRISRLSGTHSGLTRVLN